MKKTNSNSNRSGYKRGEYSLQLVSPIETWDEAIPLGNGLLGGLLWGGKNVINLSLNRGDLWDERLPKLYLADDWKWSTIEHLVKEGNQEEIERRFSKPYSLPYPSKLPSIRLVINLPNKLRAKFFALDMKNAVCEVSFGEGNKLLSFFSATRPVILVKIPTCAVEYKILRPIGLDKLSYEPAEFGTCENRTWMVQETAEKLKFVIMVGRRVEDGETFLAITISINDDNIDPLKESQLLIEEALASGYEKIFKTHKNWWHKFWKISNIKIPNPDIQHHYNLVKYLYGSGSRVGSPPMPLQGVWSRDDGDLPPWKGDYHNDLNTQMTYLPYHTAGLVESGLSFINFNFDLLPIYRNFGKSFYDVEGAVVPGVSTLHGKATGGWAQYSLSPINGIWVGQTFYLHWKYTVDKEFLAEKAYPWLSEITGSIVSLLKERKDKLYIPLSSSPEIHDNTLKSWLPPNSNYDLSLMQWSFQALAEMADALGLSKDTEKWLTLYKKLDDLNLESDAGPLTFAEGQPYNISHRHFSHAMAIHPLGMLNIKGTRRDREIVATTIQRIEEKGTKLWCGYSFSWFACMAARAGQREMALNYLNIYLNAFILRNGFHANGDQTRSGFSKFTYRPFTLEGNFLAMEAIQEMLLQSWPAKIGSKPIIHIFPSVSRLWLNVAFNNLRTQGGFKVSAERRDGITTKVKVESTVDQQLQLRDPFSATSAKWNRTDIQRKGDDLILNMKRNEILLGELI